MKQKELSRWLRAVVAVGWGLCALLAFVVGPLLAQECALGEPRLAWLEWPCLGVLWLGIGLVAAALGFAWKIFAEIGRDNSFCLENARRLRAISILALADTLLCAAVMLALLFLRALHPGLFLLLLLISAVGAGITIASAALSHLTVKAAQMQDENDLTI
mgnify:CR=1 FL=1